MRGNGMSERMILYGVITPKGPDDQALSKFLSERNRKIKKIFDDYLDCLAALEKRKMLLLPETITNLENNLCSLKAILKQVS